MVLKYIDFTIVHELDQIFQVNELDISQDNYWMLARITYEQRLKLTNTLFSSNNAKFMIAKKGKSGDVSPESMDCKRTVQFYGHEFRCSRPIVSHPPIDRFAIAT